jgi:hypothetical protein
MAISKGFLVRLWTAKDRFSGLVGLDQTSQIVELDRRPRWIV